MVMNRLTLVAVALLAVVGVGVLGGCAGMCAAPLAGAGTAADPVQVPYVSAAMKVDGDAADWDAVGFVPAPFMKKPAGSVKLCWNETGLFGVAVIKDKGIEVNTTDPWSADCVELFVQKDAATPDMPTDNTAQFCLAPTPEMGKCFVLVPQGNKADGGKIVSSWKKTADGYVIEFMIPAAVLSPAKMAAGAKLGLNFAIDDDGKALECFFCDKGENYNKPNAWGTVILKK
jgi:hypothetical protein